MDYLDCSSLLTFLDIHPSWLVVAEQNVENQLGRAK